MDHEEVAGGAVLHDNEGLGGGEEDAVRRGEVGGAKALGNGVPGLDHVGG